jgi:glucose/mannose-6-phosphate isomerase
MNLDEFTSFAKLDSLNMLGEIDNLPDQLRFAWELGQKLSEPWNDTQPVQDSIRQVILCGMGGSAIGADLVTAYLAPISPVPIIVWRDYGMPAWAHGPETLVIVSSHSGNTEEMLDAFESAHKAGCLLLAICTGGELQQRALASGLPLWMFEHAGQPRAAVGFSFGLLLAALSRLGLTGESSQTTAGAIAAAGSAMKKQQETLLSHLPAVKNPAKRQAGQLVGRWVNVYGAGYLSPVARRWKTQLNELAKAGAGFEILPEADHNALAGLGFPIDIQSHTLAIFLRSTYNDPRNHLRADLTRHTFTVEGLNTDVYEAKGNSPLEHMWTALHFGDYMAYYLAMIYGVDPTLVETLENFKAAMKVASGHVSL